MRSRLECAGHMTRIGDKKLAKGTDAKKMEEKEARKIEIAMGRLC